jgi:site-specific DNA recombinase
LRRAGAEFVSITEHIDTTTPAGRCFYTILLAFAQMEREKIGERTGTAMRKYQSEGRIMSKRLPYGWCLDPTDGTKMRPHPSEQRTIKVVLELAAQELSLKEIGLRLEQIQRFPRTGKKWRHSHIRRILNRAAESEA